MNDDKNIDDKCDLDSKLYAYLIDTPKGFDLFEQIWSQNSNNIHIINNVNQRIGSSSIIFDCPFDATEISSIKSFAIIVKNYYGGTRRWSVNLNLASDLVSNIVTEIENRTLPIFS